MEEREEDDDVRVCHDCIGEIVLKAEIQRTGRLGDCSFCANENEPTVTIAALARRIDPVFQEVVGSAPEDVIINGDRVSWGPSGESPSFLMTEMTEAADEEIGQALVSHLSDLHEWDVNEGAFDYYDDASEIYAIVDASDGQLRERWTHFCSQLKQERRFFLDDGIAVLDEIFAPLLEGRWPDGGAIRVIGPEDEDRFVYRARLANDEAESASILRQRISQLGAPRPGRAGPGRMNPAGVSVFYGAFDPKTCVAELRVPVGGSAIVGRFEIIRPLRVLDLTRLETASRRISYFEKDYAELQGYAGFVRGFHEEVKRAVLPGRETLDYLPTQIVAEYLWARANPPFDGLIFGSSQITETKNNIALFPHASIVEGFEAEVERKIHFSYTHYDEDGENAEERVTFEPLPAEPQQPQRTGRTVSDEDWFASLSSHEAPAAPEPALRLADDGVVRHRVRAIKYDTEPPIPIAFSDWQDFGF